MEETTRLVPLYLVRWSYLNLFPSSRSVPSRFVLTYYYTLYHAMQSNRGGDEEEEEEVTLTWDLYQMLPSYLVTFQTCAHCGASFRECENIGLHLCHIHPGIRMYTNAGPQRSFYSCCGRLVGGRGCTEADHSSKVLDVSDARQRVAELRDFGALVVPRLLLRFITPPLQSSVLYRGTGATTTTLFKHRFRVLARTLEMTDESSITHAFQLPVYDKAVDNAGLFTTDEDEGLVTRVYNLREEARALLDESKESPLFQRLSTLSRDKNQRARVDCENAWRSHIGRNGEEAVVNNCGFNKEAPSLPFVIISRIHDTQK